MRHVPPTPTAVRSAPSAAERARTLFGFASSVVLDIPGIDLVERPGIPPLVRCAVLPDGAFAVLVESSSPLHRIALVARADRVAAELEAVDVAPVAVPHRIRGRATAHGRLSPLPAPGPGVIEGLFPGRPADGHALLRFEPEHLAVEDLWGSECCVGPAAVAAAAPDPIAADEAALLQHLDAAHSDHLHRLAARARYAPGPLLVRPVALDRLGLRVRLIGAGRMLDARFDFHRPVTTPGQLPDALHRLFAHTGPLGSTPGR
ncbi:hypothetical protein GCM10009760_59100 [Kitasatospora kazusensis]|uniref:DUF2470 domain-containing protein n=1 Tax=Kitasatospora kazusensis TaxID=407974 RepID=A0ABN3AA18_9ACTN